MRAVRDRLNASGSCAAKDVRDARRHVASSCAKNVAGNSDAACFDALKLSFSRNSKMRETAKTCRQHAESKRLSSRAPLLTNRRGGVHAENSKLHTAMIEGMPSRTRTPDDFLRFCPLSMRGQSHISGLSQKIYNVGVAIA